MSIRKLLKIEFSKYMIDTNKYKPGSHTSRPHGSQHV